MKLLTLTIDTQLNDNGDYLTAGQIVKASDNEAYINRHEGFVPVIVESATNYNGDCVNVEPYIEWLPVNIFEELTA